MKMIFATRPSALARWQTRWVINALQGIYPDLICEEKVITTKGDKILDKPLPEIGGKGLFTQELESELLSGAVHCAVHSLKDLPVDNPIGLTVGCIPLRAEVRDALISEQLHGGRITGWRFRRDLEPAPRRPDFVASTRCPNRIVARECGYALAKS